MSILQMHKKGWHIAILLVLGFSSFSFAQIEFEEPEKPVPVREEPIASVYAELLGNAYSFSLNFDYLGRRNLGFRLGLSPLFLLDQAREDEIFPKSNEYSQTFQLLPMVLVFAGNGKHRLETGAGVVFGFTDLNMDLGLPQYPAFTGTVGYRLFPAETNITLKFAFTPIISGGQIFPRFGISFGYIL